jgi:hypothetical protein
MMARERAADARLVSVACALSFGIGLFFIFVRAPHPWGWEGIDRYRELALAAARGEPYATLDRSWGYPYFLAFFYRLFGDRQWIPLVAQAAINALLPWIVFSETRRRIDRRHAAVAALLVALFSFNTVYASTQSSDSVCTVLFVASIVGFGRARDSGSAWLFASSGLLAALALLFRPNLLLFPPVIALAAWLMRGRRPRLAYLALYGAVVFVVWLPWPVHVYRLTGRFMPSTTLGAMQIWEGTLETGSYRKDWFDNPRANLAPTPFNYSLPASRPVVATVVPADPAAMPIDVTLTYWTDRQPAHVRQTAAAIDGRFDFELGHQPAQTVVYYYFSGRWKTHDGRVQEQSTPLSGAREPLVHTISADHFGDLDLRGDLLDVFDVVRVARHVVWGEPLAAVPSLDVNGDGAIDERDLRDAVDVLTAPAHSSHAIGSHRLRTLERGDRQLRLVLSDGSALTVPRSWGGRAIDLGIDGTMAADLYRSQRLFSVVRNPTFDEPPLVDPRFGLRGGLDNVFYREQPKLYDRFMQLSAANIRAEPIGYAVATAMRVARLFVVVGSESRDRTAQFSRSQFVYLAATALSAVYFGLLIAGIAIALRRRYDVSLMVLAIVYVPATLCAMLVEMRYTVTIQPFVFAFVAVALLAAYDRRPRFEARYNRAR